MINHGMTLSAYYRDPDGNQVETQVDTLTLEEADVFMASPVFAANPIGIEVDFDQMRQRVNLACPQRQAKQVGQAVGLVLSAVFVPCAFISGITGQFYRQFALTIAVSTSPSSAVASAHAV